MTDLLPCPHCGGEAYIRRTIVNDDAMFVVFCDGCGVASAYCATRDDAYILWNQRSYTTVELDETQGFTDTVTSLSDAISLVDWTPSELLAAIGRGEIKLNFTVTGLEPNAEGELHD